MPSRSQSAPRSATSERATSGPRPRLVIGWREWLELPHLGLPPFIGKIDTGARTSALHATKIRLERREDGAVVSFRLPKTGATAGHRVSLPLHDERLIRNTGGTPEMRVIVRTALAWPGAAGRSRCR